MITWLQICKFAFKDGKVHFQNKYVRTEALIKEQAAGKMLYRGVFSVGNPSGGLFFNPFDFNVKNVANTGVMHWGNKLLALYEVRKSLRALCLSTRHVIGMTTDMLASRC